jgi:hypothetical protein
MLARADPMEMLFNASNRGRSEHVYHEIVGFYYKKQIRTVKLQKATDRNDASILFYQLISWRLK